MATRVVHCKKEKYDVYIGRPGKWGNPYSHKNETLAKFKARSLADSIEQYRQWIYQQPELLEAVKNELQGKVLGCWCKPGPCHGDILAAIAEY